MSRIAARMAALAGAQRKALVPFVTVGDPSIAATVPVMHALVAAGADVLELGMPFSDPMADGPVIQRSSERALARGIGTAQVLGAVRAFRDADADTPVVLMGYLNPIEIRGAAAFADAAADAGVDGLLLVDLPPEEAAPFRACFGARGLDLISLAAPTTSPERLQRLAEESQGYLYYVSLAGVTGAALGDGGDIAARTAELRARAQTRVLQAKLARLDRALHGEDELVGIERLGQVGIDADAVTPLQVGFLGASRQQDHLDVGRLRVGAQPAGRLPAVEPGHHDVERDDGGVDALDLVEAVLAVDGGRDLEALELEVDGDQLTDDVVVIDHEDASEAAHRPNAIPLRRGSPTASDC